MVECRGISNVLITGGNGFIGSHLGEKLVAGGDSVTLFDLHFTRNSQGLPCERVHGDVRDYQAIKQAIAWDRIAR